jgi:hypothetical protein
MIRKSSRAELIAPLIVGSIFALGLNWLRDSVATRLISGLHEAFLGAFIASHCALFVSATKLLASALSLIDLLAPLAPALFAAPIAKILVDQLDEPFQVSSRIIARREHSQRALAAKPLRNVTDFAEHCARCWGQSIERLEVYLRELQTPNIEWSQLK